METIQLKAKECAIHARNMFGFNTIEPIDIFKVLAFAEISCIKRPMGEMSGIYLNVDNVKVIIINTTKSIGHQNFTAAHEFYHSQFDKGLAGKVCIVNKYDNRDESELIADHFAAHFLMPEDGIVHYLSKRVKDLTTVSINDIIFLEQIFGVSHKAMLNRLIQLGIIDEKTMEELLPNIRHNAKVLGYDDYLYKPSNESRIISNYAEKVKMALDKDLITFSRYEELLSEAGMGFDFEEVEDYVD